MTNRMGGGWTHMVAGVHPGVELRGGRRRCPMTMKKMETIYKSKDTTTVTGSPGVRRDERQGKVRSTAPVILHDIGGRRWRRWSRSRRLEASEQAPLVWEVEDSSAVLQGSSI